MEKPTWPCTAGQTVTGQTELPDPVSGRSGWPWQGQQLDAKLSSLDSQNLGPHALSRVRSGLCHVSRDLLCPWQSLVINWCTVRGKIAERHIFAEGKQGI